MIAALGDSFHRFLLLDVPRTLSTLHLRFGVRAWKRRTTVVVLGVCALACDPGPSRPISSGGAPTTNGGGGSDGETGASPAGGSDAGRGGTPDVLSDSGIVVEEVVPGDIALNEAMSSNDGAWIDEVGEADDWVELVNRGDAPIRLVGYTLQDSSSDPIALPDVELGPGATLVLWTDDDVEQGTLHLPFKLGSSEDALHLRDPAGTLVDRLELGDLPLNETIARFPDGDGEWVQCRYATPGNLNGEDCVAPQPPTLVDDEIFTPYTLPDPYPPAPSVLVLNELSLRPSGDTATIELLNGGAAAADLSLYSVWLSPHAPAEPWPTSGIGTEVTLPATSLDPGARVTIEFAAADLATLEATVAFEGVATLFEQASGDAVDRIDFMQWPAGATLMRVPDGGALTLLCSNSTPDEVNDCDVLPSRDVGERVRALRTPGDYAALARGAAQLGIEATKFIIDMQAPGLVHLLSSEHWPLHYNFVRKHVYLQPDLDRCDPVQNDEFYQGWYDFSVAEYFDPVGRRFLLGTLSNHSGANLRAVEYTFGDAITSAQMARGYFEVLGHVLDPGQWVLRAQDADQVAKARELEGTLPIVGPNAPFEGVTYQPLTEAVGYGTLRFIPASELETTALGPDVIVITDDVPNDIPLVGGLITEAFQTPLAHVNVLSQNRQTPNAALRDARIELMDFLDQLVRVEVTAAGLVIDEATAEEATQFWEERAMTGPEIAPRIDTTVRGVQDLAAHALTSLPAIGSKASQMAELLRVTGARSGCTTQSLTFSRPASPLGVPVVHSIEHFEASGAQQLLERLQDEDEFVADPVARASGLAQVRQLVLEHPVDPDVLAAVEAAVAERFGDARVRFRSSSNTEDLPNFNGAGLYTSVSAELGDDDRRVEDALRTVWASLWNARAYDERSYARIDHSAVAMGVLVHPAFLSEKMNGVAVSRNVLDPLRGDIYYLNAQAGEATVTNPAPGVTTEQLVYRWGRTPPIIYQSESSLLSALVPTPAAVLSPQEVQHVSCALSTIHDWFRPLLDPEGQNNWFAMEIEFKLIGDARDLVIKQARPHSFGRPLDFGDCREF